MKAKEIVESKSKSKRTRRKRQKWQIGDYFLIPLVTGDFAIGQIIDRVKKALDSVICVFFDVKVKTEDEAQKKLISLSDKDVISAQLTTRDLLDWGGWKVFNNGEPLPTNNYFEAEKIVNIVGLTTYGSGIINNFINAFYGLKPWDMYFDPEYFDKLLVSPEKKPKELLYKKDLVTPK